MSTLRQHWDAWLQRRAEQKQWAHAHDFAALRELTARWCLGQMSWSAVGQPAPRDPETVPIGEALARINREGLLTSHSQPAAEFTDPAGHHIQSRSFVEGYATAETEEKLRRLIAGTRLRMTAQDDLPWRTRYRGAEPAHRFVYANAVHDDWEQLGVHLSAAAQSLELHGVPDRVLDQMEDMARITVWDPQWRPSDLLWRRLACDWEHPPALTDEDRAPADAVPSDAEVQRLDRETEAAFRERDLLQELGDDAAADVADRRADHLLDLYNAACTAQWVEVDRQRAANLARYAAEQQPTRDLFEMVDDPFAPCDRYEDEVPAALVVVLPPVPRDVDTHDQPRRR